MDEKITAVLAEYEKRMGEERGPLHELVAQGDVGGDKSGTLDAFLLAVGADSGRLINVLARSLKAPAMLELGTSYGYSAIWLGEAARASGGRLTTMEMQDYKSAHAKEMSEKAGLAAHVDFKVGDAVKMIGELPGGLDFVLLDIWDHLYVPCLEAFYPKLNPGAMIVADNIIFPGGDEVEKYKQTVRAKPGMTSITVPVGSGLEISRYMPG